jgi:hypothetical protein
MQSSSEKLVRLPTFDRSAKAFQLWQMRFVAYATVHKFSEAVSKDAPDADMPLSEAELLDESIDADKKKIAAKKRNAVAMANLSMAFTSEGTMGLVYKAMTAEWPNGLAHLVSDERTVQEVSAPRHGDVGGIEADAQQDLHEEGCKSSDYV